MARILPFPSMGLEGKLSTGTYGLEESISHTPYTLSPGAEQETLIFTGEVPYDAVADYDIAKKNVTDGLKELGIFKLLKLLFKRKKIEKSMEETFSRAEEKTKRDIAAYAITHYNNMDMQTLLPVASGLLVYNLGEEYKRSSLPQMLGYKAGNAFIQALKSVMYMVLDDPEAKLGLEGNNPLLFVSRIDYLTNQVLKSRDPAQAVDQIVNDYKLRKQFNPEVSPNSTSQYQMRA